MGIELLDSLVEQSFTKQILGHGKGVLLPLVEIEWDKGDNGSNLFAFKLPSMEEGYPHIIGCHLGKCQKQDTH